MLVTPRQPCEQELHDQCRTESLDDVASVPEWCWESESAWWCPCSDA